MDSGEREMNPVARTIINRRKEYWPGRRSIQQLCLFTFEALSVEVEAVKCVVAEVGDLAEKVEVVAVKR